MVFQSTIAELQKKLRSKEISALELTESYIKRIGSLDTKIDSFISTQFDKARATAKIVDKKIAGKDKLAPMAGIPIAIKDNMNYLDTPTTCGSKILEGYISPYNAGVVAKLIEQDAVILGKCNLDEFAMGSSTENSAIKKTKNPWDLNCVPGGSSGGSAAAVAADLCTVSLGSDTGGSIRQPASFCGIVGMKPTYGLVSRYGLVAFASSLDQIGPFAKNTEDAAILLSAIAGKDSNDSTSLDIKIPDYQKSLAGNIKGMKFAIPKDVVGEGVDDQVKKVFQESLDILKKLGAEIDEVDFKSFEYALATYYLIATAEASANLGRFDGVRYGHRTAKAKDAYELFCKTRAEGFGPEVKRRIMLGTYALSSGYYDAYYLKAQKVRKSIINDYENIFKTYDAVISPTSPTVAFKFGDKTDDPLSMYLSDIMTIPVNLAGLPGISIPCGLVNELPVGLQIVTPALTEEKMFKIADAFEKNCGFQRKVFE